MTPFASVALFRRAGSVVFKPPRKEGPTDATQARKAAMRFWRGNLATDDKLIKVILLREVDGKLEVAEAANGRWVSFDRDIPGAMQEPHLAACLSELGIDAQAAPPVVPDVLIINGFTYRRDI